MNQLDNARYYEQSYTNNESERPLFHFSPPVGWMNDPNGLSLYKGEIHLFYQYHPYSSHWGPMHWGHCKSTDFLHWDYLPVALAPDHDYDCKGCFSGTAIEKDREHYLFYTGVSLAAENSLVQQQCFAVGDGKNYSKFSGNPVVSADTHICTSSRGDFRDPKVWQDPIGTYRMIVACLNNDGQGQLVSYRSDDLQSWSYSGIFLPHIQGLGEMWECPDYFELGGKHIVLLSPKDMETDNNGIHNGNNSVYITGNQNCVGDSFIPCDVRAIDEGLDFYAPQTVKMPDGRIILIAWMQSWDTYLVPSGFGWAGMMTCPRELKLASNILYQQPVRELEKYRCDCVEYTDIAVSRKMTLPGVSGRVLDLQLSLKTEGFNSFCMRFAEGDGHFCALIYSPKDGRLTFDRTNSGIKRDVVCIRSISLEPNCDSVSIRILLDKFSVEVFANSGRNVLTATYYTEITSDAISFEADGCAIMSIKKYRIDL